jgi:RNA polymerase sigma-70 factor (ECF subfamily)
MPMNVQRARHAEPRAPTLVEALYAEHARFVRQVLRSHGVTASTLEDAVQDVFVVVFRRIDEFEPRASHKTWLYGIALRVAKDHRRRLYRKGGLLALEEKDLACPLPDPCSAAVLAQAWRGLKGRLTSLAEAQRRVFILAELEEMTGPEIAETLNVSLNTVYSRLRAARRECGFLAAHVERVAGPRTTPLSPH